MRVKMRESQDRVAVVFLFGFARCCSPSLLVCLSLQACFRSPFLLSLLLLNQQGKSEQQMKDLEVKELKNGRVAMVRLFNDISVLSPFLRLALFARLLSTSDVSITVLKSLSPSLPPSLPFFYRLPSWA